MRIALLVRRPAATAGGLAAIAALLACPGVALANPHDGVYVGRPLQDGAATVRFIVSSGKLRDLNVGHVEFDCARRADVRRNPPALDGAVAVVQGAFRGRLVHRTSRQVYAATVGGRLLERGGARGWLRYAIRFPNGDRCTASPTPLEWSATNRDLEFTSGFEPTVDVQPPVVVNSNWHFPIVGADRGYVWTTDLPGSGGSAFVPLVPDSQPVEDYADTSIQTVPGPVGSPTHALMQEVLRNAEFYPHRRVRNQFGLREPGRRGSVSYWIKLQPNLAQVMPPGERSWRFIQEIRGDGRHATDYRMSVGLLRRPTGPIMWEVAGRRLVPKYADDWTILSANPPVPIGQWFRLTTSWLISRRHGYLRVSVDGTPIANHEGRTKLQDPVDSMQIFKVYTGANSLAHGPAYQWIDDVEIRRGLLSPPPSPPPAPPRR